MDLRKNREKKSIGSITATHHAMSRLALLGVVGLALVGEGCGGMDQEGAGSLQTGNLQVTELNEAAGKLGVTFQKQGRTIRYELRLGSKMENPPSAEDLAANPELPTYDVDARVVDGNGQAFHVQMGGDSFIETDWVMAPVKDFDERGRLQDIGMMRDAVPAFRSMALPAGLEQLRLSAIEIGLSVEDAPTKPDVTVPMLSQLPTDAQNESSPGGVTARQGAFVVAIGPSSVAKWDFIVRKKCFPTCSTGNHSAVHLRGWSRATNVVYNAYSCNHGTCASDTRVMQNHCVMPGFRTDDGTHTRYFYRDGCTTRYNVTSVGGHNCNDDSELQGRAIWQDRGQSTTGGSCNSAGLHNWAPGCSY